MAIRTDGNTDNLTLTTGIPASAASLTWMCWAYLVTDTNRNGFFVYANDGAGDAVWLGLGVQGDGTTLYFTHTTAFTTGSSLSTGRWYHIAATKLRPYNVTLVYEPVHIIPRDT